MSVDKGYFLIKCLDPAIFLAAGYRLLRKLISCVCIIGICIIHVSLVNLTASSMILFDYHSIANIYSIIY